MNKNTLFCKETASLPPTLAREAEDSNMPCDHSVCGHHPTQTTSLQRGCHLSGLQYYFGTTPFLHLPTPDSAAFQIDWAPPREGKHKVPTGAPWSPRAGNYEHHETCTVLATGQKQTMRCEIDCTRPDKLYLKNRNSCLNVTCLEKAKHPLHSQ